MSACLLVRVDLVRTYLLNVEHYPAFGKSATRLLTVLSGAIYYKQQDRRTRALSGTDSSNTQTWSLGISKGRLEA